MKKIFRILRRAARQDKPYYENFFFETENADTRISTVLRLISDGEIKGDGDGRPLKWECGCLQKKCGACAMVIDGRPCLACDAKLSSYKTETILIEPLKKFPVVEDLIVDRSIMFENLKTIRLWLNEAQETDEDFLERTYESSRCLQCGCCLEICPNFYPGGEFFGMAAMVPSARLLTELRSGEREEFLKSYRKHIYEGCGKSLSCRNICPAGIDIEMLMVNLNKTAVWRIRKKQEKKKGKRK